jgi:hypothetical protein
MFFSFLRLILQGLTVICLAIGLSACSPEYNWREVHLQQLRVMMPGKPAHMAREVNLEGTRLSLNMQGARVGQQSFTVAYGLVPTGSNGSTLLASMEKGMLKNISADSMGVSVSPGTLNLTDSSGANKQSIPVRRIEARGSAPLDGRSQAVVMNALFAEHKGQVLQAVVLTHPQAGKQVQEQEAIQGFLSGVRVVSNSP